MRISTLQVFNVARYGMADVNRDLNKTQEQMATGKRVLTPSDDPVAATKILQISNELSTIDQYLKNIDIAQNNLELEETVLNSVVQLVQRMQELAVAAGNTATLTKNEYQAMASEVSARLDELMNLVNTTNANGDAIFGGYKSTQPPFVGDAFSGFSYQGDQGQQYIKIANNSTIPVTDSGKALFLDVGSAANTVDSSASKANTAVPPAKISIAQVVDQQAFDRFYPQDMVITFNADTQVSPPGKNFTVTERSTGRVIAANQPFVPGAELQFNGVSFRLIGSPSSGVAATPATLNFGAQAPQNLPQDFTPPQSFTLSVGGRTERLVLSGPINDTAELVANLTDPGNGNARRLANLGISVDAQGLRMPLGVNITAANGSAQIDAVLGLNTSAGSVSSNGQVAQAGDRFFIEATQKQGLLNTLARFKDVMDNFDGSSESKDRLTAVVASTIDNLSHAMTSLSQVQAQIGARLNTLDSTRDLHLDTQLVSRETLRDLQDLDYAEAATRLAQQSLILQAAQQAFIRVSQLSLFNRL